MMLIALLGISASFSFSTIRSLKTTSRIALVVLSLHLVFMVLPVLGFVGLICYSLVIPAACYAATGVRTLVDLYRSGVTEKEKKCLTVLVSTVCFIISVYCFLVEGKYIALSWTVAID